MATQLLSPLPAAPPRWLWAERKWNPSLHPRGPDGRFTKSSARPATPKQKKRINYVRNGPKRKPFRNPKEAAAALARTSPVPAGSLPRIPETNKALRAGRPAPDGELAAAMAPTPEPMTMFRSVPRSEFGDVAPEDLRGFVVQDAGYFPTSAAPAAPQPGEVRMRIDVPAGVNAAGSPDTSELVIDAGTEMSVDDIVTNPDGSTLMTLTALPPEGSEGGATPEPDADPVSGPDATPEPAGTPPRDYDQELADAATGNDALGAIPSGMPPRGGLNDAQLDAYEEYRDISFVPINRALRGGDPAAEIGGAWAPRVQVDHWVESMDAAMAESRVERDVVTYRGIQDARHLFGEHFNGNLEGLEWREDAYQSTSADRTIADDFAREAKDQTHAVVMRVRVPAGTGAVQLSGDEYESEALLERGLAMRVVRDSAGPPRVLDVEVVPSGQA